MGGCLRYNFSAAPLVNLTADLPPLVQARRQQWAKPLRTPTLVQYLCSPLLQTERALYVSAEDALYVTGFTAALGNPNRTWGQAGRWVQRWDGFLRGARVPGAGWMLPWTNRSCPGVCAVDDAKAVAAVDDLFLVVTSQSATVTVYNGSTGATLGVMSVAAGGSAMGNYTGWVDTPFGLTAAKTSRGSGGPGRYTVFVEEDGREKVVMYTLSIAAKSVEGELGVVHVPGAVPPPLAVEPARNAAVRPEPETR